MSQSERLDAAADGTLLDGHGKPLPVGAEPVYVRTQLCRAVDFNEFDFGVLIETQHAC